MQNEIEATFTNINKDELREKLKAIGAKQIYPEFLQKRVVFNLPSAKSAIQTIEIDTHSNVVRFNGKELIVKDIAALQEMVDVINSNEIRSINNKGWLRVRQESNKITMTYKRQDSSLIDGMLEIELEVLNFDLAFEFLEFLGCKYKAYQETYREMWEMKGVQITLDEWPFLDPFIEIEGATDELVLEVSNALGFNWENAYFGAVDGLYAKKYNIPTNRINNETPRIVFNDTNPFLNNIEGDLPDPFK